MGQKENPATGRAERADMAPRRHSMRRIITRSYLRAALVPIFVIEVALIAVYFGISSFITRKNEDLHAQNLASSRAVLLEEIRQIVPEIVAGNAKGVNLELRAVSSRMMLLQAENSRFFRDPSRFRLPGAEPGFAVAPSGVYYKTNREGCSLFYARTTRITAVERTKARDTEAFDPLFELAVKTNPNIVAAYFNSWDNMNRLYPFIDKVYEQYTPDLRMADYNFYYLADPAHDPQRVPVWTGAYLDPAGQGWMVSCVAPIYHGDFLEGVTGLDVTIENMVRQVLNLKLPWGAAAFLVDAQGVILAMPETVEKVLGLKELKQHTYREAVTKEVIKPEEFNLLKSGDPGVVEQFRAVMAGRQAIHDMRITGRDYLLAQAEVPETGWRLMALVDRERVFQPIMEADQKAREETGRLHVLARWTGYAAIVVMLVFYALFFAFLVRRSGRLSDAIGRPIARLAAATGRMGKAEEFTPLAMEGIDELDHLSEDFNRMGASLQERTQDLVEARIREKLMEKDAEIAYNAGLFESASSYLHNIGNTLVGIDGHLMKIRSVQDVSDQLPEVFRLLRQAHAEAVAAGGAGDRLPALLDRLEKMLQDKAFPRLREGVDAVVRQHEQMVQTIRHQQAMFAREKQHEGAFIQNYDPAALLEGVARDCGPILEEHGIELQLDLAQGLKLRGQKNPLVHGFFNLLKNACDSIVAAGPAEKRVRVSLRPRETGVPGAIVTVADTGGGIRPEDLPRIFTAGFTTKAEGHGLGLHSFCNFLNEHGGGIRAESPGPGQGAIFTVELGNEPKNPDR